MTTPCVLHLNSPGVVDPRELLQLPNDDCASRFLMVTCRKKPNGTGPFTLSEYTVGEKAILKRVPGRLLGRRRVSWMKSIITITARRRRHNLRHLRQASRYDLWILTCRRWELAASLPNTKVYEAITAPDRLYADAVDRTTTIACAVPSPSLQTTQRIHRRCSAGAGYWAKTITLHQFIRNKQPYQKSSATSLKQKHCWLTPAILTGSISASMSATPTARGSSIVVKS